MMVRKIGAKVQLDATVNDRVMQGSLSARFYGAKNIGRCIYENADVTELVPNLGKYDALLCGSKWHAEIVASERAPGDSDLRWHRSVTVLSGTGSRLMEPAHYVTSGGKVEWRKGQDLVLLE